MARPVKSDSASHKVLKDLHEKITGIESPDDCPDKHIKSDIKEALKDGIVSSDRMADEVIEEILLHGDSDSDRLRAAEMMKKSSDARRSDYHCIPPNEEDLERFQRVLIETGTIREAIEERREVSTSSA